MNYFGGPSVLVDPNDRLADVPSRFADLLTDEHRAVFADSCAYFNRLAEGCTINSFAQWLRQLAGAARCEIEVNLHRYRTAVVVKLEGSELSLREDVQLPARGLVLGNLLYDLILRTWERGYPFSGGLHEPRTVSDYELEVAAQTGIPNDAVAFYTTSSGDSLIAVHENAYWYSHETRDVVNAGQVDDVLETYFQHLLAGGGGHEFDFPYDSVYP